MPASVSPATVEHPPGNGVFLPRWAWALVAAVLVGLGAGAAGWLSYVSATQSSLRERAAELQADVRNLDRRLERIEHRLDELLKRLER